MIQPEKCLTIGLGHFPRAKYKQNKRTQVKCNNINKIYILALNNQANKNIE